ncbi:MAG TPA: PH domain-containing protein [Cryptosporangiaceae bacterium]|nr:PH domain-containing protein [Cryptosporangiaceae bacterium]
MPVDEPPPTREERHDRFDTAGLPITPVHIVPTDLTPSRHVMRYLLDSERYRGEWRRHWIYVARWVALGAVSTLALGYVTGAFGDNGAVFTLALVVWLGVVSVVTYKLVDWYFDRFVLTNKRVMVVGGIITRKVGMMPLLRVTDMAYVQTPLGRMLDYGTFVLESAGQDQALREIKPLPRPNKLYLLFCQEMYEPDRDLPEPSTNGGGSG